MAKIGLKGQMGLKRMLNVHYNPRSTVLGADFYMWVCAEHDEYPLIVPAAHTALRFPLITKRRPERRAGARRLKSAVRKEFLQQDIFRVSDTAEATSKPMDPFSPQKGCLNVGMNETWNEPGIEQGALDIVGWLAWVDPGFSGDFW